MTRRFSAAIPTAAASALAVAAVWVLALSIYGFYPFGSKSVLITDLGQQYIEYHGAFYDAVAGKGSLLYTWDTGLGMNFAGIYAYYLASPFTWLIFLFPRKQITEAVLFIISAKIAASGFTFSLYLNKELQVKGLLNTAFSAMYALSGYSVVFFFNLMWLDSVILLPLVILAVKNIINNKSYLPLTLAFAFLFIANFYTAYMVGVFATLYLAASLWIEGRGFKENKESTLKFIKAAALAAGVSAFVTLPAAFALADSQGTLSKDSVFLGFMTDPFTLIVKMGFGAYDSVTDYGTPFLYCGILTLGLIPVWVMHKGIPDREKKGFAFLLITMLASMILSLLDYLWHAAENPVWFPCRYSFTLIFLLISCAARAISTPAGMDIKKIIAGFITALSLVAISYLLSKIFERAFTEIYKPISSIMVINATALCFCLVLSLMVLKLKKIWRHTAVLLLALAVLAELLGNTVATFKNLDTELGFEERESYASFIDRGNQMLTALNLADKQNGTSGSKFYRAENTHARNPNEGMSVGYHAASHYSSFSRRETFSFLKSCGMFCQSGNKIFRYYGSTSALDSILGIKYVFSDDERRWGYINTGINADGIALWENPNALPLIFFAGKAVLDVKASESPFDTLNSLLNGLDYRQNNSEYYSPIDVRVEFENCETEKRPGYTFVKAQDTGAVKFIITNPKRQHVLFFLKNNFAENKAVYLNGKRLNQLGERLIRGVIELGELEPGEHEISLFVTGNKNWFANPVAASFNAGHFESLAGALKETPVSFTVSSGKFGEPVITGSFTAPQDGVLFTSIPSDWGWRVEIDGKKVKPKEVAKAFLAFAALKGEHTFKLSFRPRGLAAGFAITALSLAVFALLCIIKLLSRRKG